MGLSAGRLGTGLGGTCAEGARGFPLAAYEHLPAWRPLTIGDVITRWDLLPVEDFASQVLRVDRGRLSCSGMLGLLWGGAVRVVGVWVE